MKLHKSTGLLVYMPGVYSAFREDGASSCSGSGASQ